MSDCPVPTTQENLDLDEFIRATWYAGMQQVQSFQPKEELFCVAATYEVEPERKVPFFPAR